jgi:hypothetical protein
LFPRKQPGDIYWNRGILEGIDCATIFWGGPKLGILRKAGEIVVKTVSRIKGRLAARGAKEIPDEAIVV